MEHSGNIPIFNIPGTLFWNIPRNFIGNFFEYSKNILLECSTNIPQKYTCPVGYDMHPKDHEKRIKSSTAKIYKKRQEN